MIQFLCPNGHKIRCADDRAGKAAKCPKCGVKFRVPTPAELEGIEADRETGETEVPHPEAEESAAETPAGVRLGSATSEDQIEFLCPNNHLLHGPAELQGQPGQCPDCGSKFRIPSYEEMEDEEQETEPEPTLPPIRPAETAVSLHGPLESLEDPPVEEEVPLEPFDQAEEPVVGLGDSDVDAVPPAKTSIAALFSTLWAARANGATVELRYGDNQRLNPDEFLAGLSAGTHAVFALEEPNRTYTLTAVAWESISCVVVRGVRTLPEGSR